MIINRHVSVPAKHTYYIKGGTYVMPMAVRLPFFIGVQKVSVHFASILPLTSLIFLHSENTQRRVQHVSLSELNVI